VGDCSIGVPLDDVFYVHARCYMSSQGNKMLKRLGPTF